MLYVPVLETNNCVFRQRRVSEYLNSIMNDQQELPVL